MPEPLSWVPATDEIRFVYTNWRGDTRVRRVTPLLVWFGVTPQHPAPPQWFLRALDSDTEMIRNFVMAKMSDAAFTPASRRQVSLPPTSYAWDGSADVWRDG